MPEPEHRTPTPPEDATNTDEATLQAEDRHEDEETARQARDEAEKLGAVPWEKVKKDEP